MKAALSNWFDAPGPRRVNSQRGADIGLAQKVPVGEQADRLAGRGLDVEFQVVLQVLSDAGPIGDNRDSVLGKMRCGTDARQHQQLGRVDRGGREDHFGLGADHLDLAAACNLDAHGAAVFDHDPAGEGVHEIAIGPFQRRA